MIQPWASICRISAILILGAVLAAQNSKPLPTSPGKATQDSPQPSVHDLAKSGKAEILNDTQGVDFGSYVQGALSKVRRNWYSNIPEDAEKKRGKVAIEFAIQKDGRLTGMKVVVSSGDATLDRAAWRGITASDPFSALPEAFTGPSLALRFRFYYNLDKSDRKAEGSETADDPIPAPPLVRVQAAFANSTQADADHQPAASVLCSWPTRTTTHVEGEITTEASATDLHQYLDNNVLPMIRANWYRFTSRSGERIGGEASVEFDVLKDGSIDSVKLVDGIGHAALGDLAINAVRNSAPLPRVSSAFAGSSFGVRTHFFYEPDPNAPASSSRRANAGNEETPAFARFCTPAELSKGAVDCMVAPKPTYSPEPQFSSEARQQKREGVVAVRIVVAHDGTVQSACVNQALGYGLDEQAVNTIRSWKFTPATFNSQPIATQLLVEVDFHLYDKPDETTPRSVKETPSAPSTPVPGVASSDVMPATANAADQAFATLITVGIRKGVTPPRLISSPTPESTQSSGSAKYSGTVTLQLVVSTEGKAENIKVLKSLGPRLDQKAIDALRHWKFEPAMKDGQPVAVEIAVEVDFRLD